MICPRCPKQRVEPDRRPEALLESIPAEPAAYFRPQKRKKTRQDAALQTPERSGPRQVAHQQSQIETTYVDQLSLSDIGMVPDEDAALPARGELMCERPLHQLASLSLQPSSPSPISLRWRLVLPVLLLPVAPAPNRFRQIPPQSQFLQLQYRLVAVVSPSPLPGPVLPTRPRPGQEWRNDRRRPHLGSGTSLSSPRSLTIPTTSRFSPRRRPQSFASARSHRHYPAFPVLWVSRHTDGSGWPSRVPG